MRDVIKRLRELAKEMRNDKRRTNTQKAYYIAGISDAIELIEESIPDNIIPGLNYFVIMYHDGNEYLPYIEEMKLYKIAHSGNTRISYCFTKNLSNSKNKVDTPDLILASKKGVAERVFFTQEQAEKHLNLK